MFRVNGTPRAQDAQERRVSISHSANQCAARLCQSRTALMDERYIAIEHMDKVGGAGAGGLYQDALKHILWRSILGSLPRTVLIQTTRPSLSSNNVQLFEADSLESMHIAEDVRWLASGPHETGKVRAGTAREGGLSHVRRDNVNPMRDKQKTATSGSLRLFSKTDPNCSGR